MTVNVNVLKLREYPHEFGLEEANGLAVIAFEHERPVEKELDLRKETVEGDKFFRTVSQGQELGLYTRRRHGILFARLPKDGPSE